MGIKLMNSVAPAGHEKMVIKTSDASGGHLRLFPGTNQVVINSIYNGSAWYAYRSTDSGDTWEQLPDEFPVFLSASSNALNAAVSFNNRYYHVGDPSISGSDYYIATSNSFAQSWEWDSSTSRRITTLQCSRDGKYALGTNGGWQVDGSVFLTQDFGQTWTVEHSGEEYFNCFVDQTGQNMLAGGYTGTAKYSDDYGDTWGNFSEALTFFKGAMVSGDGNYKVVWEQYESGSNGARAYVSTDWTNWSTNYLSVRLSGGAISNDGKYMLLASSDAYNSPEPYVNLSTDYGSTWSQIDVTGGSNQYFNGCAMSSDGKYMVAIGGIKSGSTNYCYKSVDYGTTWSEITDIPGGRYNQVQMSRSGRYVYITGVNEGIFHSKDYMATWTQNFDGSTGSGTFINF